MWTDRAILERLRCWMRSWKPIFEPLRVRGPARSSHVAWGSGVATGTQRVMLRILRVERGRPSLWRMWKSRCSRSANPSSPKFRVWSRRAPRDPQKTLRVGTAPRTRRRVGERAWRADAGVPRRNRRHLRHHRRHPPPLIHPTSKARRPRRSEQSCRSLSARTTASRPYWTIVRIAF